MEDEVPKDFMAGVPEVTVQPSEMREFMDIEIDNIWFHVSTNTKINLHYIDQNTACSSIFLPSGELQVQLHDSKFSVIFNKRGTLHGVAGFVTEAAAVLAAMKRGQVPFRIDIKSLQQDNKKHLQYFFGENGEEQLKLTTFIPSVHTTVIITHHGKLSFFSPNVEKLLQASKFIYPRLHPYAVPAPQAQPAVI
ncbi:hypothetical protein O3P69_015332 [Scylla paramamosain]|uniref:Uncharacterized protein n=1 Tax=Scylla paramamosain TaxID=85552 RepID=A0AAW0T5T3_SCYPA